jgi:hypothetical protein
MEQLRRRAPTLDAATCSPDTVCQLIPTGAVDRARITRIPAGRTGGQEARMATETAGAPPTTAAGDAGGPVAC